jgi:hypothetical protein
MLPEDPRMKGRPELPLLNESRIPTGYRRGLELGERLQGLGLVLVGVLGLGFVYLIFQSGGLPGAPAPPPPPPGLNGLQVPPLISVTNCLVPGIAIASTGLILVGLRRVFDPY